MQNYDIVAQIPNKIPSKISLDSLKVKIPINEVTIIDPNLGEFHTEINVNTWDYDESKRFKKDSILYPYNGISVRVIIQKHWCFIRGKHIEYLIILVNAKILQERYFEGITKENIKLVYDRLINVQFAKFTYDSFMQSICTDIDFKKDLYCNSFISVIDQLEKKSKKYSSLNKGVKSFRKPKNQGIHFGNRETATAAYPFLKFYQKHIELINKCTVFYSEYIEPLKLDIENLVRVEFTIKNKEHFVKYKIQNTSLESILNIEQSTLESIMNDILRIHLDQRVKVIIPKLKLNIMDTFLLNAISEHIKNGLSFEQMCDNWIITKTSKPHQEIKRIKERLAKIYKAEIEGSLEDKTSIEVDSFFKDLGWS